MSGANPERERETSGASEEIARGERFAFGDNWAKFLENLSELQIEEAQNDLKKMLEVDSLEGERFLDAGCGSGIHSLAARRLGANVVSFDYDPKSVACALELKRRYYADDPNWAIGEGSVLDRDYLSGLGEFDIAYSWGVLHHTGAMFDALANIEKLVAPNGRLFISIYNDLGGASRRWRLIKRAYNASPKIIRALIVALCYPRIWGPTVIRDFLRLKPFETWRNYAKSRGMSPHRDVIDWVGGYPFEVAKPEVIFEFYRDKGFTLSKLFTCAGGHGCNQYVFARRQSSSKSVKPRPKKTKI
ncbi:MAG: class I SAM-dependent methyltransferase [Helicobacteraceae bacterium]|jgi:2-polyprenyl-6-hydroxyphenyl methylase/3-demethylubiquinone-9 3-methyltransferase|nr:class I SAM-dependent methyltransferase [Helicobacteraceae bacterium]